MTDGENNKRIDDLTELSIMLDIEALVDLRFGKLIEINPNLESAILNKSMEYYNRDHDDMWMLFDALDKETWIKHDITRTTFKKSIRTIVCDLIESAVASVSSSSDNRANGNLVVDITINFGNYKLTQKEKHMITTLVSARFDHRVLIKATNKPIEKLTPSFIRHNFDLVVIYNFNQWQVLHQDKLSKQLCRGVNFYVPYLHLDKEHSDRNFLDSYKKLNIDSSPAEFISEILWESMGIRVYFQDVRYFSAINLVRD